MRAPELPKSGVFTTSAYSKPSCNPRGLLQATIGKAARASTINPAIITS